MTQCPFCHGEIEETARKCRHCGEWVNRPADAPPLPMMNPADNDLGRAANRYVTYQLVMGVIGLIVFLIVFFSMFNREPRIPNLPSFNSGPTIPGRP